MPHHATKFRQWTMALALMPVALCAPAESGAQMFPSPQSPRSVTDLFVFGIGFLGGLPVGDFKTHEDGGGGVDVMAGFQPFRRKPLVLRANFAYMQYSALDARAYQDVCDEYSCWTELVTYRARQHSMMSLQGGPELMVTSGAWRPFAFAQGGITWFRSSARTPPSTPSGEPEDEKLFSSDNVSTSFGAGIRRVGTSIGRQVGFEISARLTRNPAARYVNEDGVQQQPDGSWVITPRVGDANIVGISVGLWIGPRNQD